MGDKGSKDKGKKEQQKKAQRSPKEKRRLKREKKKQKIRTVMHRHEYELWLRNYDLDGFSAGAWEIKKGAAFTEPH